MSTCLEDLPNELFLHLFSAYFHGVQLYRTFTGLNARLDDLLKSVDHIHLRLENSTDDQSLQFFTSKVISLYVGATHKSVDFRPPLTNVRSVTLVDATVVQMLHLLHIAPNLEHARIIWSNPYAINLVSARAFYELIFSARAAETLRSCRLYLPESHSLYLEPKRCTLLLLRSIYVQISTPLADFRRIIRLCPNLIRLEMEIIDNGYSNEETLVLLSHHEHGHIRQFHVHNLLSLDVFDIYIGYLPRLEQLYISMTLSSYPLDVFKQLSSLIHRIDRLREFHFRMSTDCWNLGHQQLEALKRLNPFFAQIRIESEDDEIVFVN